MPRAWVPHKVCLIVLPNLDLTDVLSSIKRRTAFVQHLASKHHIKHPSDEFVDAQAPSSERRQRRRRRVVVPATGLMSLPTASLAQCTLHILSV